MRQKFQLSCIAIAFAIMFGCGSKGEPLVRDTVNKVTGKLLIDGKAEPMVAVRLVRVGGPDSNAGTSKMLVPSGFTDTNGNFVIGTYEGGPEGDGAPDGEYKLTFQWGMISLLGGGRYEGDKFNGKYADPEKSEISIKVAGGPVEVPPIDLNTKDVPVMKQLPRLGVPSDPLAPPELSK